MRLFTGIDLSDEARAGAVEITAELRARVQRSAAAARITWVPVERMHLTVRFIGEVGDAVAERVIGALREPLNVAPFVMTFDRLGSFPEKGPPRVFWMGVGEGREAVVRVEALISDRLIAPGVAREDRPYNPHLTLARVRDPAGLRARALFEGLVPRMGQTRVEAITLFQSKLSPKGPTYSVLTKTRLTVA